jgi:hypothetical protein
MIYSSSQSVAVFLNPKTGTTSLVDSLTNTNYVFDECQHNHMNFDLFMRMYNPDLTNMKMFCFYRNPLDRFLSMWNYIRTTPGHMVKMVHYFHGDAIKISHLNRTPFQDLSSEVQDALTQINIITFLQSGFKDTLGSKWPLLYPQTNWVKFDNLTLLPYEDFNNGVAAITSALGVTDYKVDTLNKRTIISNDTIPTQEEIDFIKVYFKEDYDFFESVGITW